MDKDNRIQATWRWPALLGLHLLAAAVLASWLLPASRALWDGAGLWLFQCLNGSLGQVPLWDGFWAVTSTRLSDALVGALMLGLMLNSRWVFRVGELRPALFTFLGLLLVLLVVRVLFNKLVGLLDWQHASPSTLVPGTYHLSAAFPELERLFELKDRSSRSFPGDHASVLLLWALFMGLFSRGWKRAVNFGLALLFVLPRLVAGAHWLADVAVGGVFIALTSFAWGYCTPLAGHIGNGLARFSQPLWGLLQRLPLLKRLRVISPL